MKLTKKAKAFLKEVDTVSPLLPKECILCKHYNPNHLILLNSEEGYKIVCNQCNSPKTIPVLEIPSIEVQVEPVATIKTKKVKNSRLKKEKNTKRKKKSQIVEEPKELSLEAQKTIYSDDNSTIVNKLKTITDWNLAYGEPPKGFRGRVWLAESPDLEPAEIWTDEQGIIHTVYHFNSFK